MSNADSYFRNQARFEIISNRVIQREINRHRQSNANGTTNYTEREIAARVAYYHNTGMRNNPTGTYVTQFLNKWDNVVASECGQTTVPRFSLDPVK